MKNFILQHLKKGTFTVFAIYILLSAIFNERHPFTRVPMYNYMPNWAYVFYPADSSGNPLYIHQYFHHSRHIGALGHVFYAYCNENRILYGDARESKEELRRAGDAVLDFLLSAPLIKKPDVDSIFLMRKNIFYSNKETLTETDEIIAARKL